ncbi:DUF4402 domain-containing protein [Sphingorhabdus sp. EL138]|uniref:DUF4402 domain-containing protein n=1 Tax=Sphingorhabdus sp. EL138 TaxID=2073156 RepID=UPI000D69CFB9|nr:DUF4402 domain-containing protein [Sphingorhabdus sp. EL138]
MRDQKRAFKPVLARGAFMLSALVCIGLTQPVRAQSASGNATVAVNQGVNMVKNSDLHFGDFIAGTIRSVFRMNPTTSALNQRNGNAISIGGAPTAASFTASGTPLTSVRITVAENRIDIVRDGGSETMRVNRFRFDGPRNRPLDASGEATYQIGGQLRVGANQVGGTYRGTFNVTIDYQ